ncbi:hypothetical protein [Ilumatobacter sp.]|uniref:hypothetical protein n=1 Tax=Ilumatobacter sp. TaxID=1967498 RepID=UPI003B52EAF8
MHTTITAHLEQRFGRCNSPRRRNQILDRWAAIPALAGRTPTEIIDICAQPGVEQNPVVAALVRLHQDVDDDATTILMTALRPILLASAGTRCPSHVDDHTVDSDWAALAHVLATVDPTIEPTDRDGQPVAFISYLGYRLGLSRRQLDPAARRWITRRQRNMVLGATIPPRDPTTYEFDLQAGTTHASAVEDGALARIELDRIATAVSSGQIPRSRWDQLVAHRVHELTRPDDTPGRTRVAVHRTATRLAWLVDHAA